MASPPFMPLYVGDYLADTTHLTTLESGAYLHLLMGLWRYDGSISSDDATLARFAKCKGSTWARIKPVVLPFFAIEAGRISHRRLTRELAKYESWVDQKREAGLRSAQAKSLKRQGTPLTDVERTLGEPEPEPEPEPEVSGAKAPSTPPPRRAAARGARIPHDWTPTNEDRQFALESGLPLTQIEGEADGFRDYWLSRSRDACRADWSLVWKNRCRDLAKRREAVAHRQKPGGGGSSVADFASIVARRRHAAG